MCNRFPKRLSSDKIGEIGVNIVSTVVNDIFGWIFRKNHLEHDFGIDAYIDYVSENGAVTGQFIAVQIKTGKSYLSKNGSMHWYVDSPEHLNYFLNIPSPILLVVCDPDKRICFWEKLDKDKVDFREKSWRHPIPKTQILCKSDKQKIEALFGKPKDHLSDFEKDNEILKMISNHSFIMYSVPKEDIVNRNISNLKEFFTRVTRNERLTKAVLGKLYISTYGYENDSREVHQIKEVRRWAKKARRKIKEWYLCYYDNHRASTLLWIASCTCQVVAKKGVGPDGREGYLIQGNPKEFDDFLNECYAGLNEASDKWGWPEKLNYQISKQMAAELFPYIEYPSLDKGLISGG